MITLQDFVTHCQKWLKEWHVLKPGRPEHGNTETLWNTPEHPRAPRNTGTAEKPRNTEFDDVVLFSHYRPSKK